jgi:hypothetical protein
MNNVKINNMSKAILKFDLNDPDDKSEFKRVNKANDMAFALFEITRNTRKGLEYEIESKLEHAKSSGEEFDHYDVLYMVFERISEELGAHNIDIDDLL